MTTLSFKLLSLKPEGIASVGTKKSKGEQVRRWEKELKPGCGEVWPAGSQSLHAQKPPAGGWGKTVTELRQSSTRVLLCSCCPAWHTDTVSMPRNHSLPHTPWAWSTASLCIRLSKEGKAYRKLESRSMCRVLLNIPEREAVHPFYPSLPAL